MPLSAPPPDILLAPGGYLRWKERIFFKIPFIHKLRAPALRVIEALQNLFAAAVGAAASISPVGDLCFP